MATVAFKIDCPHCHYPQEEATDIDDQAGWRPTRGNIGICLECAGTFIVEDNAGSVRKVMAGDLQRIGPESARTVMLAKAAVIEAKGRAANGF